MTEESECSTFSKLSVCPRGLGCPSTHDYVKARGDPDRLSKNFDVILRKLNQIDEKIDLAMGEIRDLRKIQESINSELSWIKKDTKRCSENISKVDNKMAELVHALQTQGFSTTGISLAPPVTGRRRNLPERAQSTNPK